MKIKELTNHHLIDQLRQWGYKPKDKVKKWMTCNSWFDGIAKCINIDWSMYEITFDSEDKIMKSINKKEAKFDRIQKKLGKNYEIDAFDFWCLYGMLKDRAGDAEILFNKAKPSKKDIRDLLQPVHSIDPDDF